MLTHLGKSGIFVLANRSVSRMTFIQVDFLLAYRNSKGSDTYKYDTLKLANTIMALFESTTSAPDSAQDSLAPLLFWQLLRVFAYALRASDERTEPEAEAVVSKRAYIWKFDVFLECWKRCAGPNFIKLLSRKYRLTNVFAKQKVRMGHQSQQWKQCNFGW